jgi:translation elongation factor EF-Ts
MGGPCGLAQNSHELERVKRIAALVKTQDPKGKVKIYAKLLELDLKDALQQASAGDLNKADQWLRSYLENLRLAESILRSEHAQRPKKILAACREFDILLGKQIRQLNELKNNYAYDQQTMISEVIKAAESAREEMLTFLFGEENVRGVEQKEKDR